MKYAPLFAALFMLAACEPSASTENGADPSMLYEKKWLVTDVNGKPVSEESEAAFTFTESGRYGGNAGCNSLSGKARFDGADVRLDPGPMTKMACPEPFMAQEQAVIAALAATKTWETEDGILLFKDAGGEPAIRFKAAPPAPASQGPYQDR